MPATLTVDSLRDPVRQIPKKRPLPFWSLNSWFLGQHWDLDTNTSLISEIQRQGDDWDSSTLHVIFFPPRSVCRLGADRSGETFIAYLSNAPSDWGTVHFLVVARTGDRRVVQKAALRGILMHGVGWSRS